MVRRRSMKTMDEEMMSASDYDSDVMLGSMRKKRMMRRKRMGWLYYSVGAMVLALIVLTIIAIAAPWFSIYGKNQNIWQYTTVPNDETLLTTLKVFTVLQVVFIAFASIAFLYWSKYFFIFCILVVFISGMICVIYFGQDYKTIGSSSSQPDTEGKATRQYAWGCDIAATAISGITFLLAAWAM